MESSRVGSGVAPRARVRGSVRGWLAAAGVAVVVTGAIAGSVVGTGAAWAATTAELPRRTLPLPLKGRTVFVPVGGEVTYSSGDPAPVDARLNADLASAQGQAAALLAAVLDRDDKCGDRLRVQDGTLGARDSALRVSGVVDYGRTACVAGQSVTVVPLKAYDVDMLLHPVVAERSIQVRTEVLDLRPHGGGKVPDVLADGLRQAVGEVVSERIGELFPSGAAPADLKLRSLTFDEDRSGTLTAQAEGSGSLPRSLLLRLLKQP